MGAAVRTLLPLRYERRKAKEKNVSMNSVLINDKKMRDINGFCHNTCVKSGSEGRATAHPQAILLLFELSEKNPVDNPNCRGYNTPPNPGRDLGFLTKNQKDRAAWRCVAV